MAAKQMFTIHKDVPVPELRKITPEFGLDRLEPGDMIEVPADLGLREGTVRSTVYKEGKRLKRKFTVSKRENGSLGVWRRL